jgi:hypothetical protein
VSKLVYELDADFDEQGRAELRLPELAAGRYHLRVSVEADATANGAETHAETEPPCDTPLVIKITGEHFKWHTWEWTGYPADHVFTREDFYDEDD